MIDKFNMFFVFNKDLSNNDTRHQTIRLLNKLCIHSSDGYDKTIEIFNFYKVFINFIYKVFNLKF